MKKTSFRKLLSALLTLVLLATVFASLTLAVSAEDSPLDSDPVDFGDSFVAALTIPYANIALANVDGNVVATKTDYSTSTSATYGLSYSSLQSQGYIDSEGNLTAQYDAATANWGGDWRMPTYDELAELKNNCTWTWTTQNGVNGYKVTSKTNGNSIFLPAAGYRYGSSLSLAGSYGGYWSSAPGEYNDGLAYNLYFSSSYHGMFHDSRSYGLSVRPILE